MTGGSSQGLFVIVAVVVFGIFVAISYLLFRDKLQTGLASIFDDSIITSKDTAIPYNTVSKLSGNYANISISNSVYNISMLENINDVRASGLKTLGDIEIPYGYRLYISFEVYTSIDAIISIDLNSSPKDSSLSWNSNDNYGNNSPLDRGVKQVSYDKTKSNTWVETEFWYDNNSDSNVNKLSLFDASSFGIQSKHLNEINSYLIKNIKYKIVKL